MSDWVTITALWFTWWRSLKASCVPKLQFIPRCSTFCYGFLPCRLADGERESEREQQISLHNACLDSSRTHTHTLTLWCLFDKYCIITPQSCLPAYRQEQNGHENKLLWVIKERMKKCKKSNGQFNMKAQNPLKRPKVSWSSVAVECLVQWFLANSSTNRDKTFDYSSIIWVLTLIVTSSGKFFFFRPKLFQMVVLRKVSLWISIRCSTVQTFILLVEQRATWWRCGAELTCRYRYRGVLTAAWREKVPH